MPRLLRQDLQALGHEVESVHTLHIEGMTDGELYRNVAQDYDLCFTKDEDFARKCGESSVQGTVKVLRVIIRQQPQEAYMEEFVTHFSRSRWDQYGNGANWP